jgi:hypothetical protein
MKPLALHNTACDAPPSTLAAGVPIWLFVQ